MVDKQSNNPQPVDIPENLPLIPVRDIVVFPYMVLPLFVGRDMSVKAIEASLSENRMVFLATQKNHETDPPQPSDIFSVGTVGMIMRHLKLPDDRIKILVQGLAKARIIEYTREDSFYVVKTEKIETSTPTASSLEIEAVIRTAKESLEHLMSLGKILMPDVMAVIDNLEDPGRLADIIISNIGVKIDVTQEILEIHDSMIRLKRVTEILAKETEVLLMQQKIHAEAKGEIDKTQREYFLREQLKAIQKELGELDERAEEAAEFRKRLQEANMPDKVLKEGEKQLNRLAKMHPDTAEASTVRTFLEWLVEIPWNKHSTDNLDIRAAATVLNEDHYDLEKVKERILEYLAVHKLKAKMKGPILCFVGPPGVGKTSLGKSIARALGREFFRMSLGGLRDEAEIRGHRRTYVGALPGRIVQGLKQAGTNNPVFMLDEIDKVGMDFRGDPSSALLEVLDPEQNHAFIDHYLGLPIDLSSVMFITTANVTDPILSALRDRMEIIPIPGYTEEEKRGIARQFLIPRQREEHGITEAQIHLTDATIQTMILQYTRESGVRNLEREIAHVMRKVARRVAEGNTKRSLVSPHNLRSFLGVPKFLPEEEYDTPQVGVTTGLAWTETGGEILHIEATAMKGKGQLTLTGHLGDVMKESAQAALSYVRSQAKQFHIKPETFTHTDLHIHVPAGAIPKDGPSAGITMAVAITSSLTSIPVKKNTAMTGEVTLRGRVLPIGGLKEKILAAKRASIQNIILPKHNEKDLEDIPKHLKRGLNFIFANSMTDVMPHALSWPGKRPRLSQASNTSTPRNAKKSPGSASHTTSRSGRKTAPYLHE